MKEKKPNNSTQIEQIKQIRTDNSKKIIITRFIYVLFLTLLFIGCGKNFTPEQKIYISKIEQHRKEYNDWMKNDSNSPFNFKGKIEFHELNYFDIDQNFVFKSKLIEYEPKDTVTVYGTKGEPRKVVRFGFVSINFENQIHKINVYEGKTRSGDNYYSIWFTDFTTNKESYGVGRYIDFEKQSDPNIEYEVDFNLAYNPYCAYSSEYSCAIPTKEDFIQIAIKAGEKKFHD